jgi:putative pyruvate formate lyase activating enzyme
MFEPAYIKTLKAGTFPGKIFKAHEMLRDCCICPRNCRVNRLEGETGFCGIGASAVVSSANPHFGEESPLVGTHGSGTIFFTSCNLKCIFCQNYEISHLMEGEELTAEELADIMLRLQNSGCHNINFVTPSHIVPQILEAVYLAARDGLQVPLVYNTGGYDSPETLGLLDNVVDIYMPDLKFMDSCVSEDLMDAPDYPEIVTAGIKEMHRQVGDLDIDDRGIAVRGLLVRHLVMPDGMAGTGMAMKFLAEEISTNTYVNIMNQYRPCGRAHTMPGLGRSIDRSEYVRAIEEAKAVGITRLDERVGVKFRLF